MTKEIILQIVKLSNRSGAHLLKFLRTNHSDLLKEIIERTSFLDKGYSKTKYKVPFQARLYCIEHDITETPRCQNLECNTGNMPLWNYATRNFKKFCGTECRNKWLSKVSSEDIYREEIEESCLKKYNARNFCQSDEFKRKSEATCMRLHGVKHISSSKEWRDGVKETCRRKYHADSPLESEEVQDKARKTCLENNGVENPFNSREFQEKARETMRRNHNGNIGYAAKDIMEKVLFTSNARFGVCHYTQSIEYHKNKKRKFHSEKYPELTFDSTWEVKVYEFCKDHNIQVEYSPSISYEYEYDGKTWTYHPDFLINGKVYEIKGDHFFKYNESSSKEDMFCPYRNPKWSDEQYAWVCGKFEAKHQCMIKNNVRIMRDADIKNLCVEMFIN